MTNGDDDTANTEAEAEGETPIDGGSVSDHLDAAVDSLDGDDPVEAIEGALTELSAALELSETEADLDAVSETVETVESAIDDAEFPDSEDEDESAPKEEFADSVDKLETEIESARGPYASEVVETIEGAIDTIDDTRWTDDGEKAVLTGVTTFRESAESILEVEFGSTDTLSGCEDTLTAITDTIDSNDFDPDADAETIEELVSIGDALEAALEESEEWADLTTREQLQAKGFYDVLDHRKDYPPEWHAVKVWEKRGNAEMILLALEKLGSEFMEEHCLEALERMGPEEAVEPMLERASRRDQPAIRILGKIGSTEALETIEEFAGPDADDALRRIALKAVGEIGSTDTTETVAQGLHAETESVRVAAGRALGMIGDPRAIEPLASTLSTDESHTVRGSAAWALIQIGTERALETLGEFADDDSPIVQAEVVRAEGALET